MLEKLASVSDSVVAPTAMAEAALQGDIVQAPPPLLLPAVSSQWCSQPVQSVRDWLAAAAAVLIALLPGPLNPGPCALLELQASGRVQAA